jgi:hypothetical protein
MAGRTRPNRTLPNELKRRYLTARDPVERSHFHVPWLISRGATRARSAEPVAISDRWDRSP